jgi:hypothetical protein
VILEPGSVEYARFLQDSPEARYTVSQMSAHYSARNLRGLNPMTTATKPTGATFMEWCECYSREHECTMTVALSMAARKHPEAHADFLKLETERQQARRAASGKVRG